MGKYLIKRLIFTFITLFCIILLTFLIMHAIPGGPFTGSRAVNPEITARLNSRFGLDQPVMVQFWNYLKGILHFDFGPSYASASAAVSVNELIASGFSYSAKLGILACIFIVVLGIPMGIIAARHRNKFTDHFIMVLATIGVTLPSYVIGTIVIYFFIEKLHWLPLLGLDSPRHFIAPLLAMGGASIALVARLSRSSMLDVMGQDYIRAARANGLPEYRVIYKHALRNALIPTVTCLAPTFANVLTGSFVVEKMFAIPGMGQFTVNSITGRNYTLLMGVTIFYSLFYIVLVLVVDLIYCVIDPRIDLGSSKER